MVIEVGVASSSLPLSGSSTNLASFVLDIKNSLVEHIHLRFLVLERAQRTYFGFIYNSICEIFYQLADEVLCRPTSEMKGSANL
jgi:hypothetical protein